MLLLQLLTRLLACTHASASTAAPVVLCFPRFDGGCSPLVRLLRQQHTVDRWRGAERLGSMGLLLRLITGSLPRDERPTLDATAGSPSPAYGSTRASADARVFGCFVGSDGHGIETVGALYD